MCPVPCITCAIQSRGRQDAVENAVGRASSVGSLSREVETVVTKPLRDLVRAGQEKKDQEVLLDGSLSREVETVVTKPLRDLVRAGQKKKDQDLLSREVETVVTKPLRDLVRAGQKNTKEESELTGASWFTLRLTREFTAVENCAKLKGLEPMDVSLEEVEVLTIFT